MSILLATYQALLEVLISEGNVATYTNGPDCFENSSAAEPVAVWFAKTKSYAVYIPEPIKTIYCEQLEMVISYTLDNGKVSTTNVTLEMLEDLMNEHGFEMNCKADATEEPTSEPETVTPRERTEFKTSIWSRIPLTKAVLVGATIGGGVFYLAGKFK